MRPVPARIVVPALGLLALSLTASAVCARLYFSGGVSFEFCHYAEIAKRILLGQGLRTGCFWPGELAVFDKAGVAAVPLGPPISRYPLFACWSALWMAVGGVGDAGMLLGNAVAMALWTLAVYWAAGRFFRRRVALGAAALWALLPVLQAGYVVNGYTELLYGALVTVLLAALSRLPDEPALRSPWVCLGLGVLAGLAQLTRSSFALWLPLAALVPLRWGWAESRPQLRQSVGWGRPEPTDSGSSGRRPLAWLAAGFALAAGPWALWCLLTLGGPPPLLIWQAADGVLARGGLPCMDYRVLAWSQFLHADVLKVLLWKAWHQLNASLMDLPGMWGLELLFPFAVVGWVRSSGPARRFGGLCLVLFGWQLAVSAFLHYENLMFLGQRYFLWFSPVLLVFAADCLSGLWDRKGLRWAAVLVLGLQVQSMASLYALRYAQARRSRAEPVAALPELEYARRSLPSGCTVLTNMPAQVAWYGYRRAINVPNRLSDVPGMMRRWPADYLLFSFDPAGEPANFPEWRAALADPGGRALKELGFREIKRFPAAILFERTEPFNDLEKGRKS